MSTIYSEYSRGWKPSGYDITRKYRSFLTYTITDYTDRVEVKASMGVSLNATIDATYSCYLKSEDAQGHDITRYNANGKKTVLHGDKKVTFISTKTFTFQKTSEEKIVQVSAGVWSYNGSWDGTDMAIGLQLAVPALGAWMVTFDMHGIGTPPESQSVEDGECAVKPPTPEAFGYKFKQWVVYYAGGLIKIPFDFSTPITSNLTLHAEWEKVPVYCKQDGEWFKGMLYVKVDGEWYRLTDIYTKINGNWVRI